MAAKRRKRGTNNRAPAKGAPAGGAKAANGNQRSIVTEAVCILVIATALIVGFSLISRENAGVFGNGVQYVLFGLFGGVAFALPLIAGIVSVCVLFGKTKKVLWNKVIMGVLLFLLFAAFIYILHEGGGFFGRQIGSLFIAGLNRVGAFIFIISAGIILVILISGRSLFGFINNCFGWGSRKIKESNERRRERRLEEEELWDEEEEEFEEEENELKEEKPLTKEKPVPKPHNITYASSSSKKVFDCLIEENVNMINSMPEDAVLGDFVKEEPTSEDEDALAEIDIQLKGIGVEGYVHKTVELEGQLDDEFGTTNTSNNASGAQRNKLQQQEEEYIFPPIELLKENTDTPSLSSRAFILENSRKLEETLKSFGVEAKVVEVCKGPTVTRYELSPGVGVKVSKISGLVDDLALNLAAAGIRIEAPVPGKSVVGIEIPNKEPKAVLLREVIDDEAFWAHPSKIAFAIGKDIAGNPVIADIARMPHLLIAGATGAGKSVCINTLVASIIYKSSPQEVKLIMIDPKVVELSVYNGIPHLLIPVVTDPKKASGALSWAVREMDLRYNLFAETMTRDLRGYNEAIVARGEMALPQIVIIIDELADLMMTCGKEVEESICRLAQKARAAGIHLIIATQRPSVDVITGLIKANVPSRLAFAVSSGTDSRTILDMVGAEKLLGKGDMLFSPVGLSKPQRIQGSFISDKEVENIVNFIKRDGEEEYDNEMIEEITSSAREDSEAVEGDDEFTSDAIDFVVSKEKASVSMLQRRFRIGYNRAARLMEELEQKGIVGPEEGSKPRKVLLTYYQWQEQKRGGS